MASYTELHDLHSDGGLLARISSAISVSALAIISEDVATDNHANRLKWAKEAVQSTAATAKHLLPLVLAANKSATVAQISGAGDPAIQSNVDSVINLFADGV